MKIRYTNALLFLNYSTALVFCRRGAEAVFLNLFMTNPLHVETDLITDRRSFDQEPGLTDSTESIDKFRQHPKDIRGLSTMVNARESQPLSSSRLNDQQSVSHSNCNEDRECQLGMYCDRHYGLCKVYRTLGQLCRRDAQCAIGYDCMFGRCLVASKPGHRGARCSNDRDCLSGLCCARQHGEKICKPKLKLGQNCFVPDGGLPYWGNDMCPCDEGLVCRYAAEEDTSSTSATPSTGASQDSRSSLPEDWFNLWTDQNHMRCVES